jgi:ABC-type maltose transport system permease subunit
MKDILNRKHKFIEILYLKIILGVVAFLMLLIIINIYTTFNIKNQANTITKIQTEIPQNNILNEFKIK